MLIHGFLTALFLDEAHHGFVADLIKLIIVPIRVQLAALRIRSHEFDFVLKVRDESHPIRQLNNK